MSKEILSLYTDQLDIASSLLRALAHPLRLKLLSVIDENSSIEVKRIYNLLKIPQSSASQHLGVLLKVGLVRKERNGQNFIYSINYNKLSDVEKTIKAFVTR